MPCIHDKVYYKLMEVNKHHHYEDLKKSLEEGEVLNTETILEKVKDLDAGVEPADSVSPDFVFDMSLLRK
tara:strand:- start:465 stop:674 length:210 start_codon:yes stop_codon:yes gene_type:complete